MFPFCRTGAYPFFGKNMKPNKNIPSLFANKTYLDPTYDPAFKEFFDSEEALKDFLDGVLGLDGDDKIKKLTFTFDKSLHFRVPQRKKVVVDVFATTGSGRFLNIEMQNLEHDFFIDRIFLYKAFLIIKGKKEMELSTEFANFSEKEQKRKRYELPETVSIWICNFDLPGAKGEYMDEWAVYSRTAVGNGTAIPIFPKNRYIFFSLPNFKKSVEEVNGSVDAWLYLLNHAGDGGEQPNFGSGIIEDALERIRVDKADDELLSNQENAMAHEEDYEIMLAGAEIRAEEKGLKRGMERGIKEGIEKGIKEGREKGIKEGREKGIKEGRTEEKRNMARALKSMGDSVEKIVAVTGLTQAEVEAL